MPSMLPALMLPPFTLPAALFLNVFMLARAAPTPGSATSVIWLSMPFGSRMLYWAMVRIFLVTHPARILPRCFSPSLDRWKSPLSTKVTMSTTNWCSLRMEFTITGTIEARKLRRKTSMTTTTSPPAWKTALNFVLGPSPPAALIKEE
jgi:hypothetical protein